MGIRIKIEVEVDGIIVADEHRVIAAQARTYRPGCKSLVKTVVLGMIRRMAPAVDKACDQFYPSTPGTSFSDMQVKL